MTRDEIIELCCGDFYENFAEIGAKRVVSAEAFTTLFDLLCSCEQLPMARPQRSKLSFRAAYITEAIYLRRPELLTPHRDLFFALLPTIINPSARRHLTKVGALMLDRGFRPSNCNAVAEACAEWAISPKSRPAVKIWCIEIILHLRDEVDWAKSVLDNLLAALENDSHSAIAVRLKRWRVRIADSDRL